MLAVRAYFVQLERSSSFIQIQWIKHALAHSFELQIRANLRGDVESIATELALYGSKNECARTDHVFSPISEVSNGTVSLTNVCIEQPQLHWVC